MEFTYQHLVVDVVILDLMMPGLPRLETLARLQRILDPALAKTTGCYFDGGREAKANPQAYDATARRQLWELSERSTC